MASGTEEPELINEKYKWFLYDLGPILKGRAFQHKADRDSAPDGSEERSLLTGQVLAFNEVISILQQQADGFQISHKELRLDGIDPDNDLV
jgi:hypothetical protein